MMVAQSLTVQSQTFFRRCYTIAYVVSCAELSHTQVVIPNRSHLIAMWCAYTFHDVGHIQSPIDKTASWIFSIVFGVRISTGGFKTFCIVCATIVYHVFGKKHDAIVQNLYNSLPTYFISRSDLQIVFIRSSKIKII